MEVVNGGAATQVPLGSIRHLPLKLPGKPLLQGLPSLCREIPPDQDVRRNCWSSFAFELQDPARYGISTQTPPGLCLSWDRGPAGKTATRFGLARGKVRDEHGA